MIKDLSMLDIYLCEDASVAADLLTMKLNSVLDNLAPIRTIQTRTNFAPWISTNIKSQMGARDEAQKKAVDSKEEERKRTTGKCIKSFVIRFLGT